MVEELHKAAKTDCRVEDRQHRTADRLERVTAVQFVVAVRLLQVRGHACLAPASPAIEVVPEQWIRLIRGVRNGGKRQNPAGMTVREFDRALAQLGGFVGIKATENQAGSHSRVVSQNDNSSSEASIFRTRLVGNTQR